MERKILLKVTLEYENLDYCCNVEDLDFNEKIELKTVKRQRFGGAPYIYVTYTKVDNNDIFDRMMNESKRSTVILKAKLALERAERDRLETMLSSLDMFKAELRSN